MLATLVFFAKQISDHLAHSLVAKWLVAVCLQNALQEVTV